MRKAALLYNPDSGGRRRRQAELQSAMALLAQAGVAAELILNYSPDEAQAQARLAVQAGCDTIFACGGDGTINNIVQVLANTPVALAVLPMGTANALAHDLGLPMNIAGAARSLVQGVPRRIALGRIRYLNLEASQAERFFVVAAGAGVDAHLFYKLHSGAKQRMGMAAYYAKAWNLWFTHPMRRFLIEFAENGSKEIRRANVTEMLAVRIRNFGGVLQELAPGASLEKNDIRVVLCRTSSRVSYLAYVTRGLLRRAWTIPGIDLAYSRKISCAYLDAETFADKTPGAQPKIFVETDGELIGTLPAEISVAPDALTLLMPAKLPISGASK